MPEPPLPDALWSAVRARELLAPGRRVVVAVSGGADSVALLYALFDRRPPGLDAVQFAVAHFHHGTTPADAMREAVAAHAEHLGLPMLTDGADVAAEATREGTSFEHAARRHRYAFLARVARQWGAATVLTAHTRDDQDETILMALLEGTGLAGLGMAWRRALDDETPPVELVRPLLDVSAAVSRAYGIERDLTIVDDPANRDHERLRSRVRHEILPYLESHGNAGVRAHLRAVATQARELAALQHEQVTAMLRTSWRRADSPPTLGLGVLRSSAPSLQRAVMHAVLCDLGVSPRQLSRAGIESACALIANTPGKSLDLPGGWTAKRKGPDAIVFRHAEQSPRGTTFLLKRAPVAESVRLADPGETPFSAFGHAFSIVTEQRQITREEFARYRERNDPAEVYVQTTFSFTKPLSIRRLPLATKFTALGAPGKQRLKKFLAGRGVPAAYRAHWPVMCDSFGRVLWVIGLEIAHEARVVSFGGTASTAHYARLIEHEPGTFPAPLGPRGVAPQISP